MKTIVLTPRAGQELDALSKTARDTVTLALNEYAVSGYGDVKKLTGRHGCRLRVGSYRVIFDEDATTILAIYVGRRTSKTYSR